jgi:hypothetical protein
MSAVAHAMILFTFFTSLHIWRNYEVVNYNNFFLNRRLLNENRAHWGITLSKVVN